ncbi:hypothetical protein [Candidatus Electronema sp. JM]|uniref:hypothetical protein n=1 Tax=Candidatus Electronema sp. JM TaxID=3401571 RepID=UPI003AA971EF
MLAIPDLLSEFFCHCKFILDFILHLRPKAFNRLFADTVYLQISSAGMPLQHDSGGFEFSLPRNALLYADSNSLRKSALHPIPRP